MRCDGLIVGSQFSLQSIPQPSNQRSIHSSTHDSNIKPRYKMKQTSMLFILSFVLANVVAGETLVRKRRVKDTPLLPLQQRRFVGLDFGRVVEEVFTESLSYPYSYSYSYSYSFSNSYSYSYSFSYPSESPTLEPTLDVTGKPSANPSQGPSQAPTSAPSAVETTSPTPLDSNFNDAEAPTFGPTGGASPTSSPTSLSTSEATQGNNTVANNTSPTGIIINGGDQQTSAGGAAYLIPVIGVVTGAFVVGVAVRAIDKRNGPTEYVNLDASSHSSFSLQA